MTSFDSLNAFSKAGRIASREVTLVTPKLEPLSLGLMKQGNPIFSIMVSSEMSYPLWTNKDSAMRIPNPFRYWLSVNLLNVRAEVSTLHVE